MTSLSHTNTLTQEKEALVTEMAELKVLLDELGRELQQSKADLGEERKESRDLRTQLEVCVRFVSGFE